MNERTVPVPPDFPAVCRFYAGDGLPHLGWWNGTHIADLTASGTPWAASLSGMLSMATPLGMLAEGLASTATQYALSEVTLLAPMDGQEIWAAGVTYQRSREAREHESESAADMYARVYDAARPELFFKADASRTVGQDSQIRVRPDAHWTVPEPELALLLDADLRIAAYTIGNDVSARDIEGENPLYLPQAKIYRGACALGPWLVPAEAVPNPYDLRIACRIQRGDATIWQDETNTSQLHRKLDVLIEYLGQSNQFTAGVFLLTGTSLVPPDSITLETGDVVEIEIAGLGQLRNVVG